MSIINTARWKQYRDINKDDPYSNACVTVAAQVMKMLDTDSTPLHRGYHPDIHTPHGIICKADDDTKTGGITGFMAGCVERMVIDCHSRGAEFAEANKPPND